MSTGFPLAQMLAELSSFLGLFGVAVGAVTMIVNIIFALGVYESAGRVAYRQPLQFSGAGVWALATLFGGVFVATAFWIVHLSNLIPAPAPQNPESP